jgi:hypothetical protein
MIRRIAPGTNVDTITRSKSLSDSLSQSTGMELMSLRFQRPVETGTQVIARISKRYNFPMDTEQGDEINS